MANIKTDTILLVETFLRHVKGLAKNDEGKFPGTDSYKQMLLTDAQNLLARGFAYHTVADTLKKATPDDIQTYNVSEYFKKKAPEASPAGALVSSSQLRDDCMQPGVFYFHPMLQSTSEPPKYVLDSESMEMRKEEPEAFFLEMKEHFTLDELLHYFLKRSEQMTQPPERYKTQLKRLVDQYGLDMTLYLIDAGVNTAKDEDMMIPKVPLFYTDFLDEAKLMLDNRKEIAREGGLTHVYPKRDAGTP